MNAGGYNYTKLADLRLFYYGLTVLQSLTGTRKR